MCCLYPKKLLRPFALAVMFALFAPGTTRAAEPYLAFLRSLREHGHGDLVIEYVERISGRADLPPDVRDVLDLELSAGYRLWSQQTQNPQLAEQRLTEAKRLFDKFSAAHPDHPGSAHALIDWGDVSLLRGERIVSRVEYVQDELARTKYMIQAREAFEEAKPYYEQAGERFRKQLTGLAISSVLPDAKDAKNSAATEAEKTRQETELGLIESRLKIAGVDFYIAKSYRNPQTKERNEALKRAREGFQWVYQRCRNNEIGLRAQLWEGRANEELGNDSEALDLYDEVLAVDIIGTGADSSLAPLLAETALLRIKLLSKLEGPEAAGVEAEDWLKNHQSWKSISYYQGIALELAKATLWRAAKGPANQRGKLKQEAMSILDNVLKVPSEYSEEALALRHKHQDGEVKSTGSGFAENMAIGDLAAESGRWEDALTAYTAALEAPQDGIEPRLVRHVKNRISLARYRLAVSHYSAGKMEEVIQVAGQVAKNDPNDPYAPMASSVACFAALSLYTASPDKEKRAAADRVRKIADYMIQTWPGQPSADDALIILAQLASEQGDVDRAINHLDRVAKTSPRYPAAMVSAGRLHRSAYVEERKKPEKERQESRLEELRSKAEKYLKAGAEQGGDDSDAGSEQARSEARVLLAEMYIEDGRLQDAVPLVQPTVDRYLASGGEDELDPLTARALVTGVRAYCDARQVDKASDLALGVVRAAPDNLYVNMVLVEAAHLLRQELDASRAALDGKNANTVNPSVDHRQRAADLRQRLEKLLTAMAVRKHYSVNGLAFVADTCAILGMSKAAREASEQVIRLAEADGGAGVDKKTLNRVRFQLVELLCAENQYRDAAKYVDQLIAEHPRSLEILMQKGKVLQGYAREDVTRYDECVAHWTKVRLMLARVQPRPKEYYDVVYHAAVALYEQAYKTQDGEKARQAEQVLKSTLALDAKLDGKETVEKFNLLLEQIRKVQSRTAVPAK